MKEKQENIAGQVIIMLVIILIVYALIPKNEHYSGPDLEPVTAYTE